MVDPIPRSKTPSNDLTVMLLPPDSGNPGCATSPPRRCILLDHFPGDLRADLAGVLKDTSTIPTSSKSVAAPAAAATGLSGGTPCRRASPVPRATPPYRRRPTTATAMRSPSSTIPPRRIVPSTASSNRCAMARAARRVRSIPRRPATSASFAAVLPGEHLLYGLRNRELRLCLFGRRPYPIVAAAPMSPASSNACTSAGSSPRSPARAAGASPSSVTL